MIAALYVETDGHYFGLPDVDPWDVTRDAMRYDGAHPVVAHPPCTRWCALAGLVQHRYGYRVGDDGGTFAHAIDCVRCFGGVLEHPAYSKAWPRYDLHAPPRSGGWVRAGLLDPGWVCHVEQAQYGHSARKATWLYAVGCDLPSLRWGATPAERVTHYVGWCANHTTPDTDRPRVGKAAAARTPIEFRDLLINMARSVTG